ncbi:MAG: glycosyltransferase family 39 protein [Tepidisphaeraceae bacterium]
MTVPSPPDAEASRRRPAPRLLALLGCAALIAAYGLTAWVAVRGKSVTYDETLHATAAWVVKTRGDFRVNPEDPPLWQYWAALPHSPRALRADFAAPAWELMARDVTAHWEFTPRTLFLTPGNDGQVFVNRSRAMMLVIAAGLGLLIAAWAWELGGPMAAVASLGCYAFDPNLLAHGALVKNDVVFSLVLLALALVLWRLGRRWTWHDAVALGIVCGIGLSVKFSGVLTPVIMVLVLGVRALAPLSWPWPVMGRKLKSRGRRLVAMGTCAGAGVVAWAMIWAAYGFRFVPTPDPDVLLNTAQLIEVAGDKEVEARAVAERRQPSVQERFAWRPGLLLRAILLSEKYHLLPQAWTNGLAYTHLSVQVRGSYLMREYSNVGWWYYFPLTMLFKTPLATLAAAGVCAALAAAWWRRGLILRIPEQWWLAACLMLPPGVYFASAVASNLNLGIRHMLPVYPFVFIGVGLVVARVLHSSARPNLARALCAICALALAVETALAFPHFIPFFNAAVGGSRGGLQLLGDSNLDWGQDLPLLAEWQRQNPDRNLYLCYFGTAQPRFYGIRYRPLPGGSTRFGPQLPFPTEPGVIAISATNLQGIYMSARGRAVYGALRDSQEPFAVLGGSIYLYEWDPGSDSAQENVR